MTEAFIDSREPGDMKNKFDEEFGGRKNNSWSYEDKKKLDQGDFYLPEEDVVVERKEASDFASSTTDGRLSEQADRMIDEHEHVYLILENDIESYFDGDTYHLKSLYDLRYSHISDHSIIGMQTSLAVKRGIKIIYTESKEQTAYAVKRLFERHLDGEAGSGDSHVKTHDAGEVDDTQVAMLMQIDGISKEKAIKIAERRSINFLVPDGVYIHEDAILEDLQYIEGVGEVLAQRVINAFR